MSISDHHLLNNSPLGRETSYSAQYDRTLLYPISRHLARKTLGLIDNHLPFQGQDVWNAFELSWLNPLGKPLVAVGKFIFPCTSPNLIESKSFKLYLNSFNNTSFDSFHAVSIILTRDLSEAAGSFVEVRLTPLAECKPATLHHFSGCCLDELDIACDTYSITPDYLITEKEEITETVYSDLLKSNCPVTGQPDWASIQICYTGKKISPSGLLRYIVSFRNHNEFHEQCVERIYYDIWQRCSPQKLSVEARYTRRGGLDINPYRSSEGIIAEGNRLLRQ